MAQVVLENMATLDGRIALDPGRPAWLDPRWKGVLARRQPEPDPDRPFPAVATHVHLEGSSSFVGRAAPERFPGHSDPPTELHGDCLVHDPATDTRWMAVPDSGGRVDWRLPQESDGAYVVVLVTATTPPAYLAELRRKGIGYLLAGDGPRVDLALACRRLGEVFAVDTVLSTAGGVLNGVLLRLGLVSEIRLSLHPSVVGLREAPAIYEGYRLAANQPARLQLLAATSDDAGVVHLRYRVLPPPGLSS